MGTWTQTNNIPETVPEVSAEIVRNNDFLPSGKLSNTILMTNY